MLSSGLTLKKSKCAPMQESVQCSEYHIDAQRVNTTPDKIAEVQNAAIPQNIKLLRSFLGSVQHYGKFIANLSSQLYPLYQLLKANIKWKWNAQCNIAFKEAKQRLLEAPVMAHYDPSRPIKLISYLCLSIRDRWCCHFTLLSRWK